VLFLTLDDRAGQVQVTFFTRALPDCAWVVRASELVVAEGVVSRRGQRGATLIGRRAWDLTRLWRAWQDGVLSPALQERGTPAPHEVAAARDGSGARDRSGRSAR
jgi:error-prone DNA polymerase